MNKEKQSRNGIFNKLRDSLHMNSPELQSLDKDLRLISETATGLSSEINSPSELLALKAQTLTAMVEVSAHNFLDAMKPSSRESAEVVLEEFIGKNHKDYERAQISGNDKAREMSEVYIRIGNKVRELFEEHEDEFPSAVTYLERLGTDEQEKRLRNFERIAMESTERARRTNKTEHIKESRLAVKLLESARKIVSKKDVEE